MYTFLLVLQAIVTLALIVVILMQKSEGGGLGTGGNPASFLSARGAADFLTRATAILATAFVSIAIVLAVLASVGHRRTSINVDARAATAPAGGAAAPVTAPSTIVPVGGGQAPAAGTTPAAPAAAASPAAAPAAPAASQNGVPVQR
jgi:preprotein translocase subunit SecG